MAVESGRLRGDRVRALREKRGMTQDELGTVLKSNGRQILRYENEQTDPNSQVVWELAYFLETTADYLLGMTDDPAPKLMYEDLSAEERALIIALRNRHSSDVIQIVAALTKETP